MARSTVADEPPLQFARVAYAEVLDATKHQDDKIGRFLTAIAFLTAASLAFVNAAGLAATPFEIPGFRVQLLAILLGAFVTLAILSALWFVLSLSTQVTLPESQGITS